MAQRRVLVAGALLCSLLLVAALPTTSIAGSSPEPRFEIVVGPRTVPALLEGDARAAAIEGLVDAGADRTLVTALADGALGEQLVPAGDLDGDDLPDVLGLARPSRPGQSVLPVAETLTVTGRSGLTGAALWSAEVPGLTGFAIPGPGGVLLVTTEASGSVIGLHLTALSREGTVRWRRSERGLLAGGIVVNWPLFRGTPRRADGSTAYLLQLFDLAWVFDDTQPSSLETIVLGPDGTELSHTTDDGNGVLWSYAVPDLDGDGEDDLALTNALLFGSRGTVTARSLAGGRLWSTGGVPFRTNGWIEVSEDATGDGVADLAMGAGVGRVALLSGADGAIVWEVEGDWVSPIGDVDGDGAADIGVRTLGVDTRADMIVSDHRAYSGDGRELYHETTAVPLPSSNFQSTTLIMLVPGDFNGDGLADTLHQTTAQATDGAGSAFDGGATSGATGRRLWTKPLRQRLGGSVQGPGEDFAWIRTRGGQEVVVDALNGADLRLFWQVAFPLAANVLTSTASALDLDSDGAGEVLVTVLTRGADLSIVQHGFVLDGRTGTPRWPTT